MLRHIISLFFISILLIKGSYTLVSMTCPGGDIVVAELLAEPEENKGGAKGGAADELFEKALLPENDLFFVSVVAEYSNYSDASLPDVYPDTLTPPPNG